MFPETEMARPLLRFPTQRKSGGSATPKGGFQSHACYSNLLRPDNSSKTQNTNCVP